MYVVRASKQFDSWGSSLVRSKETDSSYEELVQVERNSMERISEVRAGAIGLDLIMDRFGRAWLSLR